jgi:hypothetical protein
MRNPTLAAAHTLTRRFASWRPSGLGRWLTVLFTMTTATVTAGHGAGPGDSIVISPVPMIHVVQPGDAPAGDDGHLPSSSASDDVPAPDAPGAVSAGLIINATFDTTITSDPNAAAIEAAINTAIANTQAMFSDPITVNITFSKMTSGLGQSVTFFGNLPYSSFLAALKADAKTANDATAIALLPNVSTNPVNGSTTINVKTANLRAVGLPASVTSDGTISVNTTITSPGSPGSTGTYNLLPVVQHEIDEVLGLGSSLPSVPSSTIFPQDLYRYSAVNTRSFTTTDSRLSGEFAYFSIDAATSFAEFDNQNDGGDFGDWQSNPRRAGVPARVQDAFATAGANPPLGVELNALDVIGYDRVITSPRPHAETIVANFGPGAGVWLLDSGPSLSLVWSQLHPFSPEAIVTGDLDGNGIDEIICDFGATYGIWVRWNNSSWSQLHGGDPSIMAIADLDGNGKKDLIVGFPGFGTYVYYNNTNWVQLHPLVPDRMVAGNIGGIGGDALVLDFGGPFPGIYVFKNNSTWQPLHGLRSVALAVADIDGNGQDDVIVSFAGGAGTWAFKNNATWFQINAASALRVAAGYFDGNAKKDLILDFGAAGIWFFNNGTTFTLFHPQTSEAFVAGDFDRNGTDDVVVDFGPGAGFWIRLDNGTWVQAHTLSPQSLNMAHLH